MEDFSNQQIFENKWPKISKTIAIASILFVVFIFLFFEISKLSVKNPSSSGLQIFTIEKGKSVFDISKSLEELGFIKNKLYFFAYAIISGKSRDLKAGDYEISPAMKVYEIANAIASGRILEKDITIPEGWNLNQIADLLEEKNIFGKEEFLSAANNDFSREFSFLADKPDSLNIEGYFFPDTYEASKKDGASFLIRKALSNLNSKLTQDMKDDMEISGQSFFEIITMASLIEKEVQSLRDKKIVSGILWKRIAIGMPLQVDATIVYILGKKSSDISANDKKIDSPYNTYKYQGLPMAPICNPGLDSIIATIYPEDSDYLYYLSAPSGKTIFSKTLQEHNAARAKYLK